MDKDESDILDPSKNNNKRKYSIEYNIPSLYEGLLEDKRFLKNKDLINELKNKKSYKRTFIENDNDIDEVFLDLNMTKKIYITLKIKN